MLEKVTSVSDTSIATGGDSYKNFALMWEWMMCDRGAMENKSLNVSLLSEYK